jgi:hypothetical protein
MRPGEACTRRAIVSMLASIMRSIARILSGLSLAMPLQRLREGTSIFRTENSSWHIPVYPYVHQRLVNSPQAMLAQF